MSLDINVKLRKVTQNDSHQLQEISKKTFVETFAAENNNNDMQKYLEESFSLNKLESELNNIDSEFYFALLNQSIVGYLKVNLGNSQTELKDQKALEIERIYVLKDFQGKNIGHMLYEKVLEIAHSLNLDYIWLGVWEENLKAINFYKKKGFIKFGKHIFKLGNDEQTDIMMKLQLSIKK